MFTQKLFLISVMLAIFSFCGSQAETIIDSINYKIDIDDFSGIPNSVVKMPVKLKNAVAIGAFLIRIEYDTSLLIPFSIGMENDSTSYDSLELVDGGWNTVHIDSINHFPARDTTYYIWARHILGNPVLHATYMGALEGSHLNIPTNAGEPSTIFNLLLNVRSDAPLGQTATISVKNSDDPTDIQVQLADTTGLLTIYPGEGPMFATAEFHVDYPECGDVNSDGAADLVDVTYLIDYLYSGGPPPILSEIGNVDGYGSINLLDITSYISFLLYGGNPLNCPPYGD